MEAKLKGKGSFRKIGICIFASLLLLLFIPSLETRSPSPDGDIDPCEQIECDRGICQVYDDGLFHCSCPTDCNKDYNPVCGSDGRTYSNLCVMGEASCRRNEKIKLVSQGKCLGTCHQGHKALSSKNSR